MSGVDDAKRILERVRLPAPASGSTAPDSWPIPPAVPIGVMLHDMARSMMIGARPPTEQERIAEGERVIAHAKSMEHGRMKLSEEAAARATEHEREQRRTAAGG